MKSLLVSGGGSGLGSTHPLAFVGQLWHRCMVNKEPATRVSQQLGLEPECVKGVLRILRHCQKVPSTERLAVLAQLDRGYDDDDIGEIFGRDAEWSSRVRADANHICVAEPIPTHLWYWDPGLRPDDPSPDEVLRCAMLVRTAKGVSREPSSGIRQFLWRGTCASFIRVCLD